MQNSIRGSIPKVVRFAVSGVLMGAADVVPGVSGGTVALVLGIYQRLVDAIRGCTKCLLSLVKADFRDFWARLRSLDFVFLIPLGIGILVAVMSLANTIETQLHDNPEEMAGLFFGLVTASIVVALRLIRHPRWCQLLIATAVAVAVFALLGLQSGPLKDPSAIVFFGSGVLAICAMILPGISGSFVLLMIGMYGAVIGAISDREFGDILLVAAGAAIGLALFSSLLGWVMESYGDLVTATMIGLMVGSLRVLWPWPNGVGVISRDQVVDGKGLAWPAANNLLAPTILALAGALLVLAVAKVSANYGHNESTPSR